MFSDIRKAFFVLTFALVFGAVFVFPNHAAAAVTLPTTSCDTQWAELNHIGDNESQEDGAKAFKFGPNNNDFVSETGGVVTFKPQLLFTPDATAIFKVYVLNNFCAVIYGDSSPAIQAGLNTITYTKATDQLQFNSEESSSIHWLPGYLIGFDVWDGVNGSAFDTYSYLIDLDSLQNPEDVEVGPPPAEEPPGAAPPPSFFETKKQNPEDLPEPEGLRPVLIIPGITGSELLSSQDELIWPNTEKMLRDVGDDFLKILNLDSNGMPTEKIKSGQVIQKVVVKNIFGKLIYNLESQGYDFNYSYFLHPYDWRLNLDETKDNLKNRIEEIKELTHFKKIDIVAHSMGGLLTKDYIKEFGENNINKLIFVGTPHLGAPKAGKVLIEGDNFDIPWLDSKTIKKIAKNFPSIYELLPSPEYFNHASGYIFSPSSGTPDKQSGLGYELSRSFFNKKGLNSKLIDLADIFFNKGLQDLSFENINAYNIVGCNRGGTQAAYFFSISDDKIMNIGYSAGDGTVPMISAEYGNWEQDHRFYIRGASHATMPSEENVRNLILSILGDKQLALSKDVSDNSGFCKFKGKQLTWRSPVEVHIYDQQGNHTGPVESGTENNIPGVDYEIINGEKFMFLPEEGNYRIEGIGEAQGEFDLLVSDVDNGEVLSTTVFNDVQIAKGSKVGITVAASPIGQIEVDGQAVMPVSILEQQDFDPPATVSEIKDLDGNLKEIILKVSDEASDVLETKYSTDGIDFLVYAEPVIIPASSAKSFYYYSIDKAGNNEEVKKLELKVLGKSIDADYVKDGSLVLDTGDNRTVYMIGNNGKKYGFISQEVFLAQGFKFENVVRRNLKNRELGGLITERSLAHPNGTLIKAGPAIWLINHDKRFLIQDMHLFNYCEFDLTQVVDANVADMELKQLIMEASYCN